MMAPLTVAIVGYYLDLADDEFQLRSLLTAQRRDFDVVFVDPYRSEARRELLRRVEGETGVRCVWFSYALPPMPRAYDWAAWNSAVLLSQSDRVFRYQQRRLMAHGILDLLSEIGGNVGFRRHQLVAHDGMLWADGIARPWRDDWTLDTRVPFMMDMSNFPGNSYGDWVVVRRDFLEVNGIDEVATLLPHYEDSDMEMRWRIAHRLGKVGGFRLLSQAMFRMGDMVSPASRARHGNGGNWAFRKDGREALTQWQRPCTNCYAAYDALSRGDNADAEFLGETNGQEWYKCACGGVFHKQSHPHFKEMQNRMEAGNLYKATVGVDGRFGRNLQAIADVLDGIEGVEDRVEELNRSWRRVAT